MNFASFPFNALRSAESLLSAAKDKAEELLAAARTACDAAALDAAKEENASFDVVGFIAGEDTFDVSKASVAEEAEIDFTLPGDGTEGTAGLEGSLSAPVIAKSDEDIAADQEASEVLRNTVETIYDAGLEDYMLSGGRAIIEERAAKLAEYYGLEVPVK